MTASSCRGAALRLLLALPLAAGVVAACGKKGPPLAPLLEVPAAPQDLSVRRAGGVVDIQLRIPANNTDNTKPADLERVEVYGFTGPVTNPADVVKQGMLVASIPVRKPPADEEEEEDPARRKQEAQQGQEKPARPAPSMENGFDQGDLVVVTEVLGPAQLEPVELKVRKAKTPAVTEEDPWQPRLRPEPRKGDRRVYFVVGVNHKGQRGAFSPPQPAWLTPPPSAPGNVKISYNEKGTTLTWDEPPDLPRPIQAPPAEGALASTSRSVPSSSGGYSVYETTPAHARAAGTAEVVAGSLAKPLNEKPLERASFTVEGVEFGRERCFAVRAAVQRDGQVAESESTPPACVTPRDTFPPAAPRGLSAVGSEGAISLIWEANAEADLAGYLVMRAEGTGAPEPLTKEPIKETTFRDTTAVRGARYVYTVVAVDNSGNRSAASNPVEETAR